jgi:hypothetical protein
MNPRLQFWAVSIVCFLTTIWLCWALGYDNRRYWAQKQEIEKGQQDLKTMSAVAYALQSARADDAKEVADCAKQKCEVGIPFVMKHGCWCASIVGNPVKP